MSTFPAPAGNAIGTEGQPMNNRGSKAGNEQLYKGFGAQSLGQNNNSMTVYPNFIAQWPTATKLRALLGDQFDVGGTFAPVVTQTVPYTINSGIRPAGPYEVPLNP